MIDKRGAHEEVCMKCSGSARALSSWGLQDQIAHEEPCVGHGLEHRLGNQLHAGVQVALGAGLEQLQAL
eukprot:8152546-Alexandrium_andersonii.AAC.1